MDDFTKGMICAAAIIASSHGEIMMAEEILQACGKINWRAIDNYDREKLRQAGVALKKFS